MAMDRTTRQTDTPWLLADEIRTTRSFVLALPLFPNGHRCGFARFLFEYIGAVSGTRMPAADNPINLGCFETGWRQPGCGSLSVIARARRNRYRRHHFTPIYALHITHHFHDPRA